METLLSVAAVSILVLVVVGKVFLPKKEVTIHIPKTPDPIITPTFPPDAVVVEMAVTDGDAPEPPVKKARKPRKKVAPKKVAKKTTKPRKPKNEQ
jgi:hypothetical protein